MTPSKCVVCGSENDTVTSLQNEAEPPREGDITVCFHCGKAYQFNKGLNLEPLDEINIPLRVLPEITKIRLVIDSFKTAAK